MKRIFLITVLISVLSLASELSAMQKACDNKVATACYEFGLLYEQGLAVEKNKSKAKEYYDKACDYGYDKACQKFEKIEVEN